ncbi:WXG100 family type VII secretion target [Amycolatopsis sp. cg13]|uniref:WXG100 family type VII secretion target n=1 Tax=Amycolatopsis sp. cg13 TaxID=3238807 RepID=UPI0035234B56
MSAVVPITDSNSTTGAGVADSWHSVVSSIQEIQHLHGGDAAAVGVEIGVSIVGAVADTAAFVLDPFGKLIAAGLGWLIEHISFLKEGLDKLAGDPAAINKMAEELHKTAENLRNAAKDLDATLQKTVANWQGDGAEAFKKNIADRRGQIDSAGEAVDAAGYVVKTTMALVSVVRSLIRDLITTFLGDVIATMLIALAMAAFTFGASIVVGVGNVIRSGISLALTMASKIARVVGLGGRTASRLAQLAEKVKPSRGGGGAHGGGNNHEMTDLNPGGSGGHGGGGGGGQGGQGGHGGHGGNNTPHEDTPGGNNHHEDAPGGNNHHDDNAGGNNTPHDDTPGNNNPHEDTPGGNNHHEDPPGGNNHHEDTPGGSNTPHEDTPGGNNHHEDTPGGNNHHEDAPGGNNNPHEERPNNQPHEDDPFDTWLAADQHFNPPPNRPHDTPGGNNHHEDTPGGGGNHENTPGGSGHDNTPGGNNHEDAPGGSGNHENTPGNTGHDNTPGGNNHHEDTPGGNNTPHEDTPGGNNHHDDQPGNNTNHEDNAGNTGHDNNAGGNHQEGNQGGGEHGNTQGNQGGTGRPSGPQSPFKVHDFSWMKKHEGWLENLCNRPEVQKYTGGKNVWKDIVKAPDDYFKTHPNLYPFMKGLADAKSSKNFVGWMGKDAVNFDKAITDIHMQAEESWKASDEEWRKEHPDPAAEGSGAE